MYIHKCFKKSYYLLTLQKAAIVSCKIIVTKKSHEFHYQSYHELKEKLKLAIENTEGFEGVD